MQHRLPEPPGFDRQRARADVLQRVQELARSDGYQLASEAQDALINTFGKFVPAIATTAAKATLASLLKFNPAELIASSPIHRNQEEL